MNYANSRPSALNSQKFFSITRTFFSTVGQNNFRNKILFFKQKKKQENHCYLKIEENIFGPDNWQQEPHSAYRKNIKCQKCAGMGLNGFILKKINEN